MKKSFVCTAAAVALLVLGMSARTFAADEAITVKGEAKCAKCALKEGEKCRKVIQAKEDGQTVTYYLAANDTAKEFKENLCKEAKQVKATGTVKEVDGKKEFAATKIERIE